MRGVVATLKARSSDAPWRMTPACSCDTPGRKPGVSTSTTSGRPKRSQRSTNHAPFCEDSASRQPPRCLGWLAMMPTGAPEMRAKPTTRLRAQRGPNSSSSPSSISRAATSRTS